MSVTVKQTAPPPSSTRGRLKSIKHWTQCDSARCVKLKEASGSPTMPSAPHWHITASGLKFSLTADITLQSHVLHLLNYVISATNKLQDQLRSFCCSSQILKLQTSCRLNANEYEQWCHSNVQISLNIISLLFCLWVLHQHLLMDCIKVTTDDRWKLADFICYKFSSRTWV